MQANNRIYYNGIDIADEIKEIGQNDFILSEFK